MNEVKLLDHRGLPIETKAAVTGMGALDREFFYSQATGSINTATVQKQPFQHHAWTYSCAYAFIINISRLHFYLYYKGKENEHINDHPVLDLFRKPNPFMPRTLEKYPRMVSVAMFSLSAVKGRLVGR